MNTLKSLWLLFALISTCTAYACQKICVFDNVTCVTRGGFNMYKNVVHGVKGLIKPLDPLYIGEIDVEMESVKYKLTNITMIGLKTCDVTKAKVNASDNTYKQYLHCPKLISHFNFETEEDSDTPVLHGKVVATITAYDYDIINQGKYSVFVNEDHRPHFFKLTHESRSRLKGYLVFAITKDCIVDSHKVNETENYMNEHWRKTEDNLNAPIVKRAMDILWNKIDVYVRRYTMGEILPEYSSHFKRNGCW